MFRTLAKLAEFFHHARGRLVQLDLTRYEKVLLHVGKLDLGAETDEGLKSRSAGLKARAGRGTPLDELLVEAFALIRESARRVLGMRPFDVQVMAAVAMHQGKLAEMQTGEGKTLAAVPPSAS